MWAWPQLIIHLVDGFGVIADRLHHQRDVSAARIRQRLAHIKGFKQRQLLGVVVNLLREGEHHVALCARGHVAPMTSLKSGARGGNRRINVAFIAGAKLPQFAAINRCAAGHGFAAYRRTEGAIYESAGSDCNRALRTGDVISKRHKNSLGYERINL